MAERSISYVFRADIGDFRAKMAEASASVNGFASQLESEQESAAGLADQLAELSDLGAKVGATAGAGFAIAVTAAANFEQSLSAVQAATGETAASMEQLRDAALQAGADTAFSATDASGAIEELAKAGVSTADILNGGLDGALDLAAAGTLEVAVAAEAAASAMTQFGLSGEDVPHIADLLAAAAGKAQGSVEDMAAALNQSGLVAAQTGLTIEEATGALAAFASAGLTGSDAGTSFKTMLQALTPSSKEAAELMNELGISAYDSQGNFVGLTTFAESLRNGLADLSVEQQNAALKTIFGSDAVRAAAVIYDQGAQGIQEWIDKTNDAGFAAEQAAVKTDNLNGDLEQLKGALETALIGTGDGQLGFLRSLTQTATDTVNIFNALPDSVQNATGSLLGIVAVIGGALFFGPKIVAGIAATRAQLALIPAVATRARIALAGLATGAGLAKSAALLGGLGLVATGTSDKLGITNTTLGAMAGLMVGGVWGAAIGAGIGGLVDLSKALGRAEVSQESFNEALASADAERIRKEIEATQAEIERTKDIVDVGGDGVGDFFNDFATGARRGIGLLFGEDRPTTDDLQKRLQELRRAADQASGSQGELAQELARQPALADASEEAILEMSEALMESRKVADESAKTFVDLGDSLNDGKTSLSDWIAELENSAKALADFRKNSQDAAKRGLDDGLIASLQEAGEAGALRMEQLANATDEEIRRANRAWRLGQREIELYVNVVGGVPEVVATRVQLDGIQQARRALRQLQADITGNPIVQRVVVQDPLTGKRTPATVGTPGGLESLLGGSADGSTVPKDGGSYSDRFPYLLAPGEEVTSNRFGQADAFRSELKDINAGLSRADVANRMMARGLAGGGTAVAFAQTRRSSTAMSVGIDYERLARVMLQARPLVGVQNVMPHDYNEFRREQDNDRRRASLGGY